MQKEVKKTLVNAYTKVFNDILDGRPPSRLVAYGISTSTTSQITRGTKCPALSTIWIVAEALGVKPSEYVRQMEVELTDDFTTIEQ